MNVNPKRTSPKKMGRNHGSQNQASPRRHHHHNHHHHAVVSTDSTGAEKTSTRETPCQTEAKDWAVSTSVPDLLKILPQYLPMGWCMYPVWNGIGFFQCSVDVSKWEAYWIKTIVISEPSATPLGSLAYSGSCPSSSTLMPTLFHVLIRTKEGLTPGRGTNASVNSTSGSKVVENSSWKYFSHATDILALLEDEPPTSNPASTESGAVDSSSTTSGTAVYRGVSTSASHQSFTNVVEKVVDMPRLVSSIGAVVTNPVSSSIATGLSSSLAPYAAISTSSQHDATSTAVSTTPYSSSTATVSSAISQAVSNTNIHQSEAESLTVNTSTRLSIDSTNNCAAGWHAPKPGRSNQTAPLVEFAPVFSSQVRSTASHHRPNAHHGSTVFIPEMKTSQNTNLTSLTHPGTSVTMNYLNYNASCVGDASLTAVGLTPAVSSVVHHQPAANQHSLPPPPPPLSEYSLVDKDSASTVSAPLTTPAESAVLSSIINNSENDFYSAFQIALALGVGATDANQGSAAAHFIQTSASAIPTTVQTITSGSLEPPPLVVTPVHAPRETISAGAPQPLPPPPPPTITSALPPSPASETICKQINESKREKIILVEEPDEKYRRLSKSSISSGSRASLPKSLVATTTSPQEYSKSLSEDKPHLDVMLQTSSMQPQYVEATRLQQKNFQQPPPQTVMRQIATPITLHQNTLPTTILQQHPAPTTLQLFSAPTTLQLNSGSISSQQLATPVTIHQHTSSPMLHYSVPATPHQRANLTTLPQLSTPTTTSKLTTSTSLYQHLTLTSMHNHAAVTSSHQQGTMSILLHEATPIQQRSNPTSLHQKPSPTILQQPAISAVLPQPTQVAEPSTLLQAATTTPPQLHIAVTPPQLRAPSTPPQKTSSNSPPQLCANDAQSSVLQSFTFSNAKEGSFSPNKARSESNMLQLTVVPSTMPADNAPSLTPPPPLLVKITKNEEKLRVKPSKGCSCPHCGKTFAYKSLVQKHVKRMHKERVVDGSSELGAIVVFNGQLDDSLEVSKVDTNDELSKPPPPDPSTKVEAKLDLVDPIDEAGDDDDDEENAFFDGVCGKCGGQTIQGNCTKAGCASPRPFKCPLCKKGFTKKCHLTAHERIHTGERPFRCPQCVQAFAEKSKLNRHMKIHSGEKPFQCAACRKAFTEKRSLKVHVQRLHSSASRSSRASSPRVTLTSTSTVAEASRESTASPATTPTEASSHASSATPIVMTSAASLTETPSALVPRVVAAADLKNVFSAPTSVSIVGVTGAHPSGLVTFPAFPHAGAIAIASLPPAPHEAALSLMTGAPTTAIDVITTSPGGAATALHPNHLNTHIVHPGGAVEHATAIQIPHAAAAIQLPHSAAAHPVAVINPKTLSGLMGAMQAQNLNANAVGFKAAAAAVAAATGHTTLDATPLFTSPHV